MGLIFLLPRCFCAKGRKAEIISQRGKVLRATLAPKYLRWGSSFEMLQFTLLELDVVSYPGDWLKKWIF